MSKTGWVIVQDGVPETIRPAELSFFSLTERLDQISRQQDPLERLDAVVDWQIFQPVLDRVFPVVAPKGPGGRPAYPRLFLCKILVLQRLYQLSDQATQYQILDRLSFQRFLGLNLADPVPDQNTVREFREALQKAGAFASLFEVFSSFLAGQGLLPKEGVMVDASFVEVPRPRNTREENALVKTGQTPADWSAKKRAHKDVGRPLNQEERAGLLRLQGPHQGEHPDQAHRVGGRDERQRPRQPGGRRGHVRRQRLLGPAGAGEDGG